MIPSSNLFGNIGQIVKITIIIFWWKKAPTHILLIYNLVIFTVGSASHVALNENPTVGIEGARPANSCIPPSFPGSMTVY